MNATFLARRKISISTAQAILNNHYSTEVFGSALLGLRYIEAEKLIPQLYNLINNEESFYHAILYLIGVKYDIQYKYNHDVTLYKNLEFFIHSNIKDDRMSEFRYALHHFFKTVWRSPHVYA